MDNTSDQPLVGIIMGSQSDWSTMKESAELLKLFEIPFETEIVSAHRTPVQTKFRRPSHFGARYRAQYVHSYWS